MSDAITVSRETVFDAIQMGIGVVDPAGRIVLMNRAFRESLGLPLDAFPPGTLVVDAVRASALRGVYGPGDPETQVAAVMAADRTKPGRLRRRTFAGRSFDIYNSPLPDGGYIVSAIEITALLAARADAEAELAQTHSAVTTLRIGLALFDPRRRLLLANPRFAVLLALPPGRVVPGFNFDAMLDLMATHEEFASPDGAAFIACLRAAAFGPHWTGRRQRADGRSIDLVIDPLPDGGCTIAITDITTQVRIEDEAQRRTRMLDSVLLNVPHGICVYGPDRRVAMINETYNRVMDGAPLQVGDSLANVIRRRAEAGEYGEGDPETVIATQMAFDIARPQMRRRVRPNGTAIDIRTAPMPDGGHLSVVTDITRMRETETELRRAKERAEAANQAKSRFLATMSHELRTPLNAIIGFSDALVQEKLPAGLVAEYSGQINDAGKQLLSLINLVLDVARIESGGFEPNAEIVDLNRAIAVAEQQVHGAAQAGEIAIERTVSDDLPKLHGDERRIIQAFSELLSNAVKFTEPGGSVWIRTGVTHEADVFVTVTDTGIGIPDAERERIFEPFTQVDASLSRRYPGAGLGLFTARAIVTAHGGHLTLTSRPGQGTVARVVLPAARIVKTGNG